ncbi:MAG: hemerythrin domain-containing protein [Desulfomicrobium apsheronum]|nr:hemerythrin domain-containing protein [Desulfomicrobium apsheronum]
MKAVDELRNEHQGIERMLRILQSIAGKLAKDEQIVSGQLDGIMEFLSVFVDECHHGKEEEILFPALEAAGVPCEGGPIGDLLGEHKQGRKLVARLKKSVESYTSGDMASAADVQVIINEYVGLMIQHIEKENKGLFLMAESKLDIAKDHEIIEAFDTLERERIGLGKHDEFHTLLDRLYVEYLQ